MFLAPVIWLLTVVPPDSAELSGKRWQDVVAELPNEDTANELPAWPAAREVEVTRVVEEGSGGLRIRAKWTLRSLVAKPYADRLLGPGARVLSATFNGKPATLIRTRAGVFVFGEVNGVATVELEAWVDADPVREPVELTLLPAVSGTLQVQAPGFHANLLAGATSQPAIRGREGFLVGDRKLTVSLTADEERREDARETLAVAQVGLGLTVGDADIRGRARAVWEVRRGELSTVSLDVAGLGDDLEVTGTGIREVRRAAGRIDIDLQAPSRDRVQVDLKWSTPVAAGTESRALFPTLIPAGSYRTQTAVQLARDGEVEALPALDGWAPRTAAELPPWAQGLVEGTPTSAYTTSERAAGHLDLLRFVPVAGPPVVIDVADYTVATSQAGRTLLKARYEIRNERAAALTIRPPPGGKIIGARVAGETALPSRTADGAWRIPLKRSVETVEGLLTFAVEVTLLGETDEWARRERRELAFPVVDAPVAVSRVTLYLPPGYRSKLRAGKANVVANFDRGEGITYGFGMGDVQAVHADSVYQRAVQNWLDNDFEAAQNDLDELQALGAANDNIGRLQANLDVLDGRTSGKDKTLERRVKEQAKARALADLNLQEENRRKAEESYRAGNYEQAKAEYKAALDIGKNLERFEQEESVEQQQANEVLAEQIVITEKQAKRSRKRRRWGKSKAKLNNQKVSSTSRQTTTVVDAKQVTLSTAAEGRMSVDNLNGLPPAGLETSTRRDATEEADNVALDDTLILVEDDSEPVPEPEPIQRDSVRVLAGVSVSRGGLRSRRNARRARRRAQKNKKPQGPATPPSDAPPAKKRAMQGLAAPKATASAMSVVIPSAGQRVRYQRVLLEPDARFTIQIDAREPFFGRFRR